MSKSRNLATLLGSDGSVKTTKYVDEKGGVADFVASGTLPNGQAVILKDDGTVEAVASSGSASAIPASAISTFSASSTSTIYAAFDPSDANKFVISFEDDGNNDYYCVVVGTVSGTSLTFGSVYVAFSRRLISIGPVVFDPNNAGKFVISQRNHINLAGNQHGTVKVGTISGTTVSFGSENTFHTLNDAGPPIVTFDPNTNNQFVVSYYADGDGTRFKVGTISGTSISFGTEASLPSAIVSWSPLAAFDPTTAGKFVVIYKPFSGSGVYSVVGTVSGTSISFGTQVTISSDTVSYVRGLAFNPATAHTFLAQYTSGNVVRNVIGTISGTNVSFGSANLNSVASYACRMAFTPGNSGQFVTIYRDDNDGNILKLEVGTVSGTNITYDSPVSFYAHDGGDVLGASNAIAFDPSNPLNFITCFRSNQNGLGYGKAVLSQLQGVVTTNLTADNFIGISSATYADGETATVTLAGSVSDNQSGLTIGATHYVQGDGSISTVSDSPAVNIGKSLSATKLLLKGI